MDRERLLLALTIITASEDELHDLSIPSNYHAVLRQLGVDRYMSMSALRTTCRNILIDAIMESNE